LVERGKDSVWVLEGKDVLGRFNFKNVHGGIKFSETGEEVFIPSKE